MKVISVFVLVTVLVTGCKKKDKESGGGASGGDPESVSELSVGRSLLVQSHYLNVGYKAQLPSDKTLALPVKIPAAQALEYHGEDLGWLGTEAMMWLKVALTDDEGVDCVSSTFEGESGSQRVTFVHFREGLQLPSSLHGMGGVILDTGPAEDDTMPCMFGYPPLADKNCKCYATKCNFPSDCNMFCSARPSELDLDPASYYEDSRPLSQIEAGEALIKQ